MNTKNKNQKDIVSEDISIETLHVLNAIKTSFSPEMAKESKELIFEKIGRTIDFHNSEKDSIKRKRIKKLLQVLTIAAVCILLLVPFSFIIYTKGYNSGYAKIDDTLVELKVPQGAISSITLPDSTKVILNGGSKLIYPTRFDKERKVTLIGEAFFDVTQNEEKPFFVYSCNLTAKVLGTQFNLKAYGGEHKTVLTLKSGSVYAIPEDSSVEEGLILKPSQQVVVDRYTKEMTRRNVIVQDFIAWKDGVIVFRDNTLEEIGMFLEKQFSIPIQITSTGLKKERYSAQFKHGENVYQILNKLSYKRGWKYEFDNGKIKIISR